MVGRNVWGLELAPGGIGSTRRDTGPDRRRNRPLDSMRNGVTYGPAGLHILTHPSLFIEPLQAARNSRD